MIEAKRRPYVPAGSKRNTISRGNAACSLVQHCNMATDPFLAVGFTFATIFAFPLPFLFMFFNYKFWWKKSYVEVYPSILYTSYACITCFFLVGMVIWTTYFFCWKLIDCSIETTGQIYLTIIVDCYVALSYPPPPPLRHPYVWATHTRARGPYNTQKKEKKYVRPANR